MGSVKKSLPRTALLKVLWDIQRKRRFIGHDDMTKIAEEFAISRMELEGVVSFYHFLHRKNAGKYTIYINNAIVSKHKDFDTIKSAFEKELGIATGEVTKDKMFGLFETSCIGMSDQETAVMINFIPFTELTPRKVKRIISHLRSGGKPEEISSTPKLNLRYTPGNGRTVFFKKYEPGKALAAVSKMNPQEVIELVKSSKLSGRGGAYFPTGLKWEFCSKYLSNTKYIICNADEGEPGTFKDRVLMQKLPGLMIEGMIIAGYAVGATKGFIYLRAEYLYLKEGIEKAIDAFREKGLLGDKISVLNGFSFDVEVFLGAGAYVCGEETAMIASMEGKRGEPSTKQYFPVEKGYLQKPTVVNNVETLCAVPRILEMGLDNWLKLGTEKTPGTKIISVSGDCGKPGVYEIEWGMKVDVFLEKIEAHDPYLILFNGYSGECLAPVDFHRTISGENLLSESFGFNLNDPAVYKQKMSAVGVRSGGSFMVFDKSRNFIEIFKNINEFFVAESCGVCTPCRTGNFLLGRKIKKLILGHAERSDLKAIKDWSTIIKTSSRCGLGQTSSNSLLCAMHKFPEVFEEMLTGDSDFNKAFDLEKAVAKYNEIIHEIETNYG